MRNNNIKNDINRVFDRKISSLIKEKFDLNLLLVQAGDSSAVISAVTASFDRMIIEINELREQLKQEISPLG